MRGRVGAGATLVVLGVVLPFAGAIVLRALVLKPYRIPSEAIVPTLQTGDRIVVWRRGGDPRIGEIVVFHPPRAPRAARSAGSNAGPRSPARSRAGQVRA